MFVMACRFCNDLRPLSNEKELQLHGRFDIDEVRASSERGCKGCQVLMKSYPHSDAMPFHTIDVYLGDRLRIDVDAPWDWLKSTFPFVMEESPWSCLPIYSILKPLAPVFTSAIPRIRNWIDECKSTHKSCAVIEEAQLPTRVIDVGSVSVEPSLHISQPGERADYCALSHCWGPPDPSVPKVVTTRDNIEENCKEISLRTLPKTFRQAVEVVRELGIQYLWIDSLCIIQGDNDDWAREASRMADVYSQATLMIAADWSPNGSGGLFPLNKVIPTPSTDRLVRFDQKDKAGKIHAVYQMNRNPGYMYIDHAAKGVDFCLHRDNSRKLGERAWCMQERALSSRIIHFCDVEMLWECRSTVEPLCVCGTRAGAGDNDYTVGPSHFNGRISRDAERENSHFRLSEDWQGIVHTYTRRDITYGTDRLPAISGLARRFPIRNSSYIAGMWHTEYMYRDLVWYNIKGFDKDHPPWGVVAGFHVVEGPGLFDRLPRSYAPSWSWASIIAPVAFDSCLTSTRDHDWEVLDVSFRLASSDPFGPVSSALLTLRSYLMPVISVEAIYIWTDLGDKLGNDCRVSWDAGSDAKEWCEKGFELAVLPALWQMKRFYGLVVRRTLDERVAEVGKGSWQRIGFLWNSETRLDWDVYDERKKEWTSRNEKVNLVLE